MSPKRVCAVETFQALPKKALANPELGRIESPVFGHVHGDRQRCAKARRARYAYSGGWGSRQSHLAGRRSGTPKHRAAAAGNAAVP